MGNCCKSKNAALDDQNRVVTPGIDQKFCTNYVSTTKYTVVTFLPRNFYEQFRRVANLYFLIMACLASIPQISPINAATSWTPLVIVIGVTAFREAYEDYKRHRSDVEMNAREIQCVRNGQWKLLKWSEVKVGDIVKIQKNKPNKTQNPNDKESSFFAADILLLLSSEVSGDGNVPAGLCFVETKDLDGETNLKPKKVASTTVNYSEEDAMKFNGSIECNPPNPVLENFQGILRMPIGTTERVGFENLLLRGSNLKNTEWVIGCVLYTGNDTKVLRNMNKEAPSKRSNIERMMNRLIFFVFGLLFTCCLIGGIGSGCFVKLKASDIWYMQPSSHTPTYDVSNSAASGVVTFFTFFILLSQMVPISLYVQVEIVKTFFAVFVSWDLSLYGFKVDTPAKANTSNLGEELGQVEYIFSDKTGTLTQNKLEFLKCSIGGTVYGEGITEVEREKARQEGKILVEEEEEDDDEGNDEGDNILGDIKRQESKLPPGWRFKSKLLMNRAWEQQSNAAQIDQFFTLLAICHDARVEVQDDGSILYPALSPDESALVKAAKYIGFEFVARRPGKPGCISIQKGTDILEYSVLASFEFNSDRKRSSVLVRSPRNELVLYIKGAETAIMKLLASTDTLRPITESHLQDFAAQGLRTLTLAKRNISEDFLQDWLPRYASATTDEELASVAAEIECNLELLGATAIEDSLQEGVGECIQRLMSANIKLWVLTGDVTRTAIEIGYACSLIRKATMDVLIVEFHKGDNASDLSEKEKLSLVKQKLTEALQQTQNPNTNKEFVLVIEAAVLGYALMPEGEDEGCRQLLLTIGSHCRTVICCRVSPKQKAEITLMVKNTGVVTLAIGDGANDVAMIQAAHIGIGIKGIEGSQAALAADYAFAQFKFLAPLLLEHGHWSYRRISTIVCYSFYKNITFAMCLFWFCMYSGFSGQNMFDDLYISCYNLFFTSLQVFGYGLFERDVNRRTLQVYPWLYIVGQRNRLFDIPRFATWIVGALLHSVIIFFCTVYMHNGTTIIQDGWNIGMFDIGTTICSNVIFVVSLTLALESRSFNYMTALCYVVGAVVWYVFIFAYHGMPPGQLGNGFDTRDNVYYLVFNLMNSCQWWFSMMFCLAVCAVPQFAYHSMQALQVIPAEWVDITRFWFHKWRFHDKDLPQEDPIKGRTEIKKTVLENLVKTKQEKQQQLARANSILLENQISQMPHRSDDFVKALERKDGSKFYTFGAATQEELKDYTVGFNYTNPPPLSTSNAATAYTTQRPSLQEVAPYMVAGHHHHHQQNQNAPPVIQAPVFRAPAVIPSVRSAEEFIPIAPITPASEPAQPVAFNNMRERSNDFVSADTFNILPPVADPYSQLYADLQPIDEDRSPYRSEQEFKGFAANSNENSRVYNDSANNSQIYGSQGYNNNDNNNNNGIFPPASEYNPAQYTPMLVPPYTSTYQGNNVQRIVPTGSFGGFVPSSNNNNNSNNNNGDSYGNYADSTPSYSQQFGSLQPMQPLQSVQIRSNNNSNNNPGTREIQV